MKTLMKLISSMLLLIILLSLFISCADDTVKTADTQAAGDNTGEKSEDTAPAQLQPDVPETDFGGYKFRIMTRDAQHEKWQTIDVYSEGANGDPINDAVYERNRMLEEEFNVVVTSVPVFNPGTEIKKYILANDDVVDVVTESLGGVGLSTLSVENLLADYNDVDYINYNQPWWDTNLIEGFSIKNKVYYLTGDISIMDNYGTWAICFNKDMAADHNLPNPYELVENGTWTYDAMFDMMKPIPKDLDGNGVVDDTDQFGFIGESFNMYALLAGAGTKITTKNNDDLPELTIFTERNMSALDKVAMLMTDKSMTLLSDNVTGKYTSIFNECINKNFGEGKVLFWMGSMYVIGVLRQYDVNFGLLPAPKYDEQQENYYGTFSNSNCTAYSIPITNPDYNRTGLLLEAMAAYSMYTLTPAYNETTLIGKSFRDSESEAMLGLIFSSRLYDLGTIYGWGEMFNTIRQMATNTTINFASQYASLEVSAQTALISLSHRWIDGNGKINQKPGKRLSLIGLVLWRLELM